MDNKSLFSMENSRLPTDFDDSASFLSSNLQNNPARNAGENINASAANPANMPEQIKNLYQINDSLKTKIRDLEIKLINESLATQNAVTLYRNLKVERDNYKGLYEKKNFESPGLKRKSSPLKGKEDSFNITLEMLKNNNEEQSITQISQTHDEIEQIVRNSSLSKEEKGKLFDYVESCRELEFDLEKYKTLWKDTKRVNDILEDSIKKYNEERNQIKFCIRCKENFTPINNNETSCLYHPGKLKYYSCRGCGADEYHTCCNHCTKCEKGCRTGKHLSAD